MVKDAWNRWEICTILAVIVAVMAPGCCPPNCPPTVIAPPVGGWNDLLEKGEYGALIEATSAASKNRDGDYYAEANLYNGLAQLGRGEDLKAALERLDTAEQLSADLATLDPTVELTLLYRGKMVVHARLGDPEAARKYLALAIQTSPGLEQEIHQEFEDALR